MPAIATITQTVLPAIPVLGVPDRSNLAPMACPVVRSAAAVNAVVGVVADQPIRASVRVILPARRVARADPLRWVGPWAVSRVDLRVVRQAAGLADPVAIPAPTVLGASVAVDAGVARAARGVVMVRAAAMVDAGAKVGDRSDSAPAVKPI